MRYSIYFILFLSISFIYADGCTDQNACNYDPNESIDDGSCLYFDCNEECGGSAQLDHCNLCEGSNECLQITGFDVIYSPGIYDFIIPEGVFKIDSVIMVGGGGSAGHDESAGGGGGALAFKIEIPVNQNEPYEIVVGSGGSYSHNNSQQVEESGYYSSAFGCTAGGGGGAHSFQNNRGGLGGIVSGNCDGGGSGGEGGGQPTNYGNSIGDSGSNIGGGGAGGYAGDGGKGGDSSSQNATDGAGGAGGGGGSTFNGNTEAYGGGGGGTGVWGMGPSGSAGTAAGGQGGSGGQDGFGINSSWQSGSLYEDSHPHGGYPGGGGGCGDSYSGDGADGAVRVVISDRINNFIFANNQQVEAGSYVQIPILINSNEAIDAITFFIDIFSSNGAPALLEEFTIISNIEGSNSIITQVDNGQASVLLSDLGDIVGNNIEIADLVIFIPDDANNGETYSLNFTNVTGSSPEYELISFISYYNSELSVITSAPEINGLADVYLLEGSSSTLGFNVSDPEGTDINVEIVDGPEYVSLSFAQGSNTGYISIAPEFGDQSAGVIITATNSEPIPEVTSIEFNVFINHYPVLSPTETIYIVDGEEISFSISIADEDSNEISYSLATVPDYVTFTQTSNTTGDLVIAPTGGLASSGDVVFDITDDGIPPAEFSSGFSIIVNQAPEINNLANFHVVENDVLDTLITFYDYNSDPLTFEIIDSPDYITYEVYGDNEGLNLTIAPDGESTSGTFTLQVTDPGNGAVTASSSITIYETFIAGDVRPWGEDLDGDGNSDDADEFGDGMVFAPDVANNLKVSTGDPEEVVDEQSDLYNAHDIFPADEDLNGDGDVYDASERGGDGVVDANDVIYSLKAATMVPGYDTYRRADLDYPHSSGTRSSGEPANRTDDVVNLGSTSGYPGQSVSIPVTIQRGDGGQLSAFISGFGLSFSQEIELVDDIEFEIILDADTFIASDEDYLSLLVMDLDPIESEEEILIGYIHFIIPMEVSQSDDLVISVNAPSGSTPSYDTISMMPGTPGVITIDATQQSMDMVLNPNQINFSSFGVDLSESSFLDILSDASVLVAYSDQGDYFAPDFGIDQIGQPVLGEGYYIYSSSQDAVDLNILGMSVDLDTPIELYPYYVNLVSYFPYETRSAESVFDGLPVIYVSNDMGQYYLPSLGINSIDEAGGMNQGQAFEVVMGGEEPVNLIYGDGSDFRSENVDGQHHIDTQTQRYADALSPTGISYPVILTDIIGDVEVGDEVAAYAGGTLVGATRVADVDRPVVIATWKAFNNYGASLDGFSDGDAIELRLYSSELNSEVNLDASLSSGVYGEQLFSYGTAEVLSESSLPDGYIIEAAYPNPFNPSTSFRFGLPASEHIRVVVHDISGSVVETLVDSEMSAGYHQVTWNASEQSSGVYFVKLVGSMGVSTQKIVLVK